MMMKGTNKNNEGLFMRSGGRDPKNTSRVGAAKKKNDIMVVRSLAVILPTLPRCLHGTEGLGVHERFETNSNPEQSTFFRARENQWNPGRKWKWKTCINA
jgi:hypothetical protein